MIRRIAAAVLGASLAACGAGGGGSAGLPTGDHVHSLAVTTDGDLLLGLHGGLYRSDDGEVWELVGLHGEDAMVLAASLDQPIFVAGHEVLYRSDDGGETFTPLRPADLPGLDLHAFAQAPTDGRSVYAYAVGHGLFWSGDAGETWEQRADAGHVPPDLFGIAVTGDGSDTLAMTSPGSGIYRSTDGGVTLESVAAISAWAVAVDPTDSRVVWALTGEGLGRSSDLGETWETVSSLPGVDGQPLALAVGDGDLWLVTEEPRSLYRSSDGGETWEQVAGP